LVSKEKQIQDAKNNEKKVSEEKAVLVEGGGGKTIHPPQTPERKKG